MRAGFKDVVSEEEFTRDSVAWSEAYRRGQTMDGNSLEQLFDADELESLRGVAVKDYEAGKSTDGRFILYKRAGGGDT